MTKGTYFRTAARLDVRRHLRLPPAERTDPGLPHHPARATRPGPGSLRQHPLHPSATNDLIATGRSLLDITTNLIKTRNQMSDGGSIMRDVDDVQKVGKGHAVLDSVESMTGGPQQPCG